MNAGFHAGRSMGSNGGRAIRRGQVTRKGPAKDIRSTTAGSENKALRDGGAGGVKNFPTLLSVEKGKVRAFQDSFPAIKSLGNF
jgi:hypothetical protein